MKQRVGIARALAARPRVLLLDEPLGALDALTRVNLQDELVRIVDATRSTVVMVTHDIDEAILLSDRIVMMTNGPAATIGNVLQNDLPRRAIASRSRPIGNTASTASTCCNVSIRNRHGIGIAARPQPTPRSIPGRAPADSQNCGKIKTLDEWRSLRGCQFLARSIT